MIIKLSTLFLITGVLAVAGCSSSGGTAASPGAVAQAPAEAQTALKALQEAGIGYLTADQLNDKLLSGKPPVLVNALTGDSYRELHIKGSISIPAGQVPMLAPQVIPDKNAEVVVYCAGYKCMASVEAAKALKKLGYTNVSDFKGGLKEWSDRKLPLEGSKAPKR